MERPDVQLRGSTERASDDRVMRTDQVAAFRRLFQTGSLVPDLDRIARALLARGVVAA